MAAWAGLGYYARARNLHKCAQVVAREKNGIFPEDLKTLKTLPGIGDYTAAAIRAIAFDKPATVVDGNIERIVARFFRIETPIPIGKKEIRKHAAYIMENRTDRPGDFAQALMDIGATVCTPANPQCLICPLATSCQGKDIAAALPARAPKKPKPQKRGYVYWITNENGDLLAQRRPEKGLLGGMTGLPTSAWENTESPARHPDFVPADAEPSSQFQIFHSFTHFDLSLTGVFIKTLPTGTPLDKSFFWIPRENIRQTGFPTLFKKFVNIVPL
ncbi:MAG: A/G-specific adenine glycosylase, partial [Alphaproteobacteria bacterium]|nr:A/G-specific adenine glycosylase [Alphaproteobacteria bacterium]